MAKRRARKSSAKKFCLKANGRVMKGYRLAKGGRCVKAKGKK
jgi:hypothetical protein